jgi:hypothetical protein
MSAPDTNTDKQEKEHRPSLLGIRGAMIFGALMMIGLIGFNMINAGDGDAVSNADAEGSSSTVVDTDVYAPGTNSSSTPTQTD